MTFQGNPIDPEKPVYILCGNYSGKKGDAFFPVKEGEEKKYPFTRVIRGIVTDMRFHPDAPGSAFYIRLWCSSIGWPEISMHANQKYYWGKSAKEIRTQIKVP